MNRAELEFPKIYLAFRSKIQHYLTRLVGEHEAEDLTQDVFIKVNHALENFRGESQLSTWLYRIATNAALDRLRSPSFQGNAQNKSADDSAVFENIEHQVLIGEKAPSLDATLIRKEINECIRNFIENLPANYRTVVVLSELQELTDNEIAEILGVSLNVVKIRLHRARTMLRKELGTHCSFYRDDRNELACDLNSAFQDFRETY